jgi:hypothetical protein
MLALLHSVASPSWILNVVSSALPELIATQVHLVPVWWLNDRSMLNGEREISRNT